MKKLSAQPGIKSAIYTPKLFHFHNTTKTRCFLTSEQLSPKNWPKSWATIYYKSYPRFAQIILPEPKGVSLSLVDALQNRDSQRKFASRKVPLQDFGDLVYFSCGSKKFLNQDIEDRRFYPSAGARYPLEIYPFVFKVEGITNGGYHYHVKTHSLERILDEKLALEIFKQFDQNWIKDSAVLFIVTAVFSRTEEKYGDRSYRHILTECGHVAQNIYLVATALNLGCCSIGGFIDDGINRLLDLDFEDEGVVGAVVVGNK